MDINIEGLGALKRALDRVHTGVPRGWCMFATSWLVASVDVLH